MRTWLAAIGLTLISGFAGAAQDSSSNPARMQQYRLEKYGDAYRLALHEVAVPTLRLLAKFSCECAPLRSIGATCSFFAANTAALTPVI